MLRCLRPNNQQGGTQPNPSAERLLKDLLSPQPPLDLPLDIAPPNRGSRPSSTHQGVGTRSHTHNPTACGTKSANRDQMETYLGTSWSLALGWREGSVLLEHIGHPLQRATSPTRTYLTLYIHKNTNGNFRKMKWQRTMFQTKEQDISPEEPLRDVEIGHLPEKEFRVMTVKMIKELGKRTMHKMRSFLYDLYEVNSRCV